MNTPLYLIQHMPSNQFTYLGGNISEAYTSLLDSAFGFFHLTGESPRPADLLNPFALHFDSGAVYRLRALANLGSLITPDSVTEHRILAPYAETCISLYQARRVSIGAGLYWEKLCAPGQPQKEIFKTVYCSQTALVIKAPLTACKIIVQSGRGKIERERPEVSSGFQVAIELLGIGGATHE